MERGSNFGAASTLFGCDPCGRTVPFGGRSPGTYVERFAGRVCERVRSSAAGQRPIYWFCRSTSDGCRCERSCHRSDGRENESQGASADVGFFKLVADERPGNRFKSNQGE